MRKILFVLFGLIYFGESLSPGSDLAKYKPLFPPSTSIVDVVEYGAGDGASNRTALIIDRDGRVGVAWICESENAPPRLVRDSEIGKVVWNSGALDLARALPKNEIPLSAERITNPTTGTVFHAVLTVVLVKGENRRTAGYKVYLFQQTAQKILTALVRDYDLVRGVFLDDVNGDGMPELAVEWTENAKKIGGMDLWAISGSDHLSALMIPSPPRKYTLDFSTDFVSFQERYLGRGNRTIVESVCVPGSGHPVTREISYKWDNGSHRYRIARVQEIREIRQTLPLESQN